MRYRLLGLGGTLRREVLDIAEGDLHQAIDLAKAMLARHHDCEAIEIFSEVRFVAAVDRGATAPAERASWV
jgi:hypothetical protein